MDLASAAFLLATLPQAPPQQAPDPLDPRLAATRVSVAPAIDGRLDESLWDGIPGASGFRQREPAEGSSATERTVVRIAYDETMLYVAAEMFDAEPSLLRATELRRDDALDSDDRFTVLFDTFDDNRNGFVFHVNALGTKYDATVRDEGRLRADWDEQWEAAARVTETGWAAEMAIPFKVLRFPGGGGAQEWGINFERVIKRKNETAHWSGWSQD